MTPSPAEAAFRADVQGGRFVRGTAQGRWRLLGIEWPVAFIAVNARERAGAPNEFVLRFDLIGYPTDAPTAGLWDMEGGRLLVDVGRPTGGPNVAIAFRSDWEQGRSLYLPCDRVALNGHADWKTKHAARAWRTGCDITHYLNIVHELLHSDSYTGTRGAAA